MLALFFFSGIEGQPTRRILCLDMVLCRPGCFKISYPLFYPHVVVTSLIGSSLVMLSCLALISCIHLCCVDTFLLVICSMQAFHSASYVAQFTFSSHM